MRSAVALCYHTLVLINSRIQYLAFFFLPIIPTLESNDFVSFLIFTVCGLGLGVMVLMAI